MQLLKHFKELTVRPKNARELKGLILKLAVQGKLTDNWRSENPDIESASKLLERVIVEKEKLIKEKKIKKEKPLPNIKKEDLINNLPNKWISVRLGEIGDWGAGSTPLRSNSLFYDGEINWFKSGELNNGIIDYESNEKITEFALKKASLRLNNPGDVLIAMYGATIGKTGILNISGTTNQAVCACTPFSCISSSYLHLLLKALKDTFINQGEGGAQPNISRVKIRNQVFGLPPLEEQKAIVAIVETLFKEVEQLEQLTVERIALKEKFVASALSQLTTNNAKKEWAYLQEHFHSFFNETANIKKLRETVLQLALHGILTKSWRSENSNLLGGLELLNNINAKNSKKKDKLNKRDIEEKKEVLGVCNNSDIPESWVWCALHDLANFWNGKAHESGVDENGEYKLVNSRFVSTNGKKMKHTNLALSPLSINDIAIVMSDVPDGRALARCFLVKENNKYTLNQRIGGITLFEEVNPEYMVLVLDRNQHYLSFNDGRKQSNLKRIQMISCPIPLPPLEEQKAIVQKVNALMGLCDALEQQVQQSREQSEQLMQSCLREVFEG